MLDLVAAILLTTHGTVALVASTAPSAGVEIQGNSALLPGVSASVRLLAPTGRPEAWSVTAEVRVLLARF